MRHFISAICLLLAVCTVFSGMPILANAYASDDCDGSHYTTTAQPKVFDDVPLYYQADYPNTPYGNGTVATSGCGITCLAMVASYLNSYEYTPDLLAYYFGDVPGNNVERMEIASQSLGLTYDKLIRWEEVIDSLANDKIVIILVNNGSVFTNTQHFLVLTGLTEDGKILVNDPNKSNYSVSALQEGYKKGFLHSDISAGFDGAWAYERPEKVTKYTPPATSVETAAKAEDPTVPTESTEATEATEATTSATTTPIEETTAPTESPAFEPTGFNGIPLYFQTDYPNVPFGSSTLASNGASITALSMVASYLTEKTFSPEDLANRFGSYSGSNMQKMENASKALAIPAYKKVYNWDDVMAALDSGDVAIVLMGRNSDFADSEHFLVLAGLTEDGRILINDPYEPNYSKSNLQDRYQNGFPQSVISSGFNGAWVYKKPVEKSQQTSPISYDSVPVYFQTDYPNIRYGNGTIATSGCSMTCLAMVASYLTGHEYLPNDVVRYLVEFNGNHMERLEYGSDFLQLPWSKADNFHKAYQALQEGKVVIALMNESSIFTTGQHFITLTGLTEDGRILVNDPNEANYSHWRLKKGFEEGFITSDISTGYSGAWIYDKCNMPDKPFIYVEEEEANPEPSRYPEISLTAAEMVLLAKVIWLEARGESFEGQQAVAEVVFNRMVSDGFPDSLKSIVFTTEQFPSIPFLDTAEPIAMQYDAIERALNGPYVLPMDVMYYARFAVTEKVWGKIGGHIFCYEE